MFLFRLEIDHDNYKTLDNCKDVTLLASTLKLFFRELPEPIIPKDVRIQVPTNNLPIHNNYYITTTTTTYLLLLHTYYYHIPITTTYLLL